MSDILSLRNFDFNCTLVKCFVLDWKTEVFMLTQMKTIQNNLSNNKMSKENFVVHNFTNHISNKNLIK